MAKSWEQPLVKGKNMIDTLPRLKQIAAQKSLLRSLSSEAKNSVLKNLSAKLKDNQTEILAANEQDVAAYKNSPQFQKAFLDRLILNEKRIQQMQESLESVASMKDPIGEVVETKILANGLQLQKVRGALGVIFLIFEARPNVITEAFSLALKAGNALILKGGKESDNTSKVIYKLIEESLFKENLDPSLFWGLTAAPREVTDFLIKQNKLIDILIPRGGDRLIDYVTENSNIPIIKNDRGLCHIYVHTDADQKMALQILDNAKTQRPSVCNSAETVLVDQAIAAEFLPAMHSLLSSKGVSFFACEKSFCFLKNNENVLLADAKSFDTEYLDLKLNVKVVENITEAIQHIETHGSQHSEAIITSNKTSAQFFQNKVDAAAVYWNSSTRFTDGGQFGLGAEIGISTQKLHVRGPVGLEALTSLRWIIQGNGHIRD
jgi:glutamate-5-semialdehyde dehydrogenase